MPKINIASSDIERVLKKHGFSLASQKGSHQQLKGIVNGIKRRVTVLANKRDFDVKTFQSMVRQPGLKEEEFFEDKR